MQHTTQRRNQAFKIAYLTEVQRIIYAVTLNAFVHGWALWIIQKLIPSAYTVLMFLAALHRAGRYGYIGTAVAYELLSPQIVKATARKCSVRTLKRGLAFLRACGLVELRPWTMPEQKVTVNGRTIVVSAGTARIDLGMDRWATRQLRIVVLTDRAIGLWDKSTKSNGNRIIRHFRTCAILAPDSQNEQVGKPTMLDLQSTKQGPMSELRNRRSDNAPASVPTSPLDGDALKGRPTRPVCSPDASPPTIEHRTFTTKAPADQIQPTRQTGEPSSTAPVSGEAQTRSGAHGCSRPKPQIKRGAPKSYSIACARILAELHLALDRFSTREADAIFDRARYELSREYPRGWPTSVDWAYWTGRWNDFQPTQRRFHIMRDILPILKSKFPVTPCEPKRYREISGAIETGHGADRPKNIKTELSDYLAKLSKRFCGDFS